MKRLLVIGFVLGWVAAAACGDDAAGSPDSSGADAATVDVTDAADAVAGADVEGEDVDVAPDAADTCPSADGQPGDALPSVCSGACAHQDVVATRVAGGQTRALGEGHFGLTLSAGAATTLYVEATEGAGPGCPTETSPTPAYLLTLSGAELPLGTTTLTEADGLNATLVDFEGDLLPDGLVFASADAIALTPTAAALCTACAEPITAVDPGAFVAFDVEVAIVSADGDPLVTVAGHVYAPHCDSLDATE
ncbi:MAG: hypothetical protein CVU56_23025 [Deltaproteobacteria bacterium HGW-Deltaproteobacteria-14]|jgi:hypothetical protein|nr:MAG: hypothetical protein CVU56_23025 [Deltaproteobacteria bacterium HGW-Deltaproteobacteria-14]